MSRAVVLDAGPLGLVTNPRRSVRSTACAHWLQGLIAAGARVLLPEIADYEVRRDTSGNNGTHDTQAEDPKKRDSDPPLVPPPVKLIRLEGQYSGQYKDVWDFQAELQVEDGTVKEGRIRANSRPHLHSPRVRVVGGHRRARWAGPSAGAGAVQAKG